VGECLDDDEERDDELSVIRPWRRDLISLLRFKISSKMFLRPVLTSISLRSASVCFLRISITCC